MTIRYTYLGFTKVKRIIKGFTHGNSIRHTSGGLIIRKNIAVLTPLARGGVEKACKDGII